MLLIGHFMLVSLGVSLCLMNVWWITVEQGFRRIVEPDNVNRWPVINLDSQQPFCNVWQHIDGTE
jgi:hypothetical protein